MLFESALVKKLLKDGVDSRDILPTCKDLDLIMDYDLIEREIEREEFLKRTKNPKKEIRDRLKELIEQKIEEIKSGNAKILSISKPKEKTIKSIIVIGHYVQIHCPKGKGKKVEVKIKYVSQTADRLIPLVEQKTQKILEYCSGCGEIYSQTEPKEIYQNLKID